MAQYDIQGKQGEKFTIGDVEDLSNLRNLSASLRPGGMNVALYHMDRVIEGSRKQAYSIMCYRETGTDRFVSVL